MVGGIKRGMLREQHTPREKEVDDPVSSGTNHSENCASLVPSRCVKGTAGSRLAYVVID